MFEKIKQRINKVLENAKNRQEIIDKKITHTFNDNVAKETQWIPLKSGGTNFKTHNLVQQSLTRLKYQISTGGLIFILVFGLIGISVFAGGLYSIFITSNLSGLFLVFFGLIFSIVALIMYFIMGKPIFIDRSIGMMYKGNKLPKLSGQHDNSDKVYLNNIHAIQVIKEYIRSDKSSYYSYEINFIMKDATRVNVVDHGNYEQIKLDAKEIARFVGKPLWDATQL